MVELKGYSDVDYHAIKDYFPKKEIGKYTNKGGYRILSFFAIYKSNFYLLWEDDRVIGCGVIRWKWSRDTKSFGWWLYAIWINPNSRGKGYGVLLIESLFKELRMRNIKEVYLTVDNSNTIAKNLYDKLGFKGIQQKNQYTVMQYEL